MTGGTVDYGAAAAADAAGCGCRRGWG